MYRLVNRRTSPAATNHAADANEHEHYKANKAADLHLMRPRTEESGYSRPADGEAAAARIS
jgi:hypothetical protein